MTDLNPTIRSLQGSDIPPDPETKNWTPLLYGLAVIGAGAAAGVLALAWQAWRVVG